MNQEVKLPAVAPKRKKRASSLDRRKARSGWLFVLPFAIGFVLIYLPIIYNSIVFSFSKLEIVTGVGYKLTPVGFQNYSDALFVDASFVQTLITGLKQLVIDIPAIVVFSLFMAILLNQKMVGRAAFRAIFFVPVILSTGLIESIDIGNSLLSYMSDTSSVDMGNNATSTSDIISAVDIQNLFQNMVVGTDLIQYVVQIVNDIYNIVNRSGVQMLIFLAGLQSISPAIYESCTIEGATAWETFWKITLPMISPMILVNLVYTIIDSFTSASNTVMSYITTVYEGGGNALELSSAMSWMYFILVLVLVGIATAIAGLFVFYQRRDR